MWRKNVTQVRLIIKFIRFGTVPLALTTHAQFNKNSWVSCGNLKTNLLSSSAFQIFQILISSIFIGKLWNEFRLLISLASPVFHKTDCFHNSNPLLSSSMSSVKATMEFSNKVQQNLHYNYLNKQRVAADSLHQSIFRLSRLSSK